MKKLHSGNLNRNKNYYLCNNNNIRQNKKQIKHTQNMPAKPLISFIVYNHDTKPASLSECLDSIAQLSLAAADREIIVVDDAETADSLNMLIGKEDEIM